MRVSLSQIITWEDRFLTLSCSVIAVCKPFPSLPLPLCSIWITDTLIWYLSVLEGCQTFYFPLACLLPEKSENCRQCIIWSSLTPAALNTLSYRFQWNSSWDKKIFHLQNGKDTGCRTKLSSSSACLSCGCGPEKNIGLTCDWPV